MELRHAERYEAQSLKVLWRTCFQDEWAYINLFFDDLFDPRNVVVLTEDGFIRSMAVLLPTELKAEKETVPVFYLYAMCTHPDCRGKGYGRQLLDYAAEYARLHGAAALTLVPGEPSLFHYYRQAGYETAFWNRIITTPIRNLPLANGCLLPVTAQKYNEIRRAALRRLPHIDYSDAFVEHQLQVCAQASGGLLRLDLPQGTACAAVEKVGPGESILKELVAPPLAEYAALALLLRNPRTKGLTARLPVRPGEPGAKPFGMVKWLTMRRWNLDHAYLGLALD